VSVEIKSGDGYIEAGEGPPVVMIPGMEGSKWFWRFQVEGLSGDYRAVSCDLPVRKPRLSTCMGDYADAVLGTMDSLGIKKAVIIGESMGGMITQHIVLEHPERVRAIVLCNTMDRPRPPGFGLNMFTVATLAHQVAFLPFLSDDQRRRLLMWVGKHRGFVMDPTPGNADLVEYIMRHGLECGGASYVDRMIAGGKVAFTDRLHEIDVPALVLRGTEDRMVLPETVLQLAGRIKGAEVALIEEGGHCCQHTVPDEVNAVLLDWLARKV
jgi:pimeloyl-ACP methyl ester carboxylesterase